ncbi:orexin/Hypocretin receptor type 1-like [Littorina saxatilis]|uniref:G-protein coupled receptors family 1 profile domain-containing protein n=1 Tax=Littorina saxatilis TaxID=31220 RepID=A0AAN9BYM2_9CAEN
MDVLVSRTSCNNVNHNTTISNTNNNLIHHLNDKDLLQCLNDEKAFLYIPVIVFLGVLVITGTIGNTLVLCVYWRKAYKASSHYFILSLAILDLFSCLVGLPTEIADLRFPYLFDMPIACKLLRFTHSSTIIASSSILIQVAFDRYYRICRLGQQFSVKKAKLLCVMAILLGVLTSWPSCLLFGRKTLRLHVQSSARQGHVSRLGAMTQRVAHQDLGKASLLGERVLLASDCSTEDSMRGTIYPTIYYLFLFSLFFLTVLFFAVLYIRIGVAIWQRNRKTIGSTVFTKVNSHGSDQTSTEISSETEPDPHNPNHKHNPNHHHNPPPPTHYITGTLTRGITKKKSGGGEPEPEVTATCKRRQIRVGKTTTVLFAVTLAYILSFLPYLVVMILRSTIKGFEGRLSPVGEVAYKFCVKSFFINNAINPLIYSFLNAGFRKDASKTLRKMWHNCCCRCFCCGRSCCCDDGDLDVLPRQKPIAV